VFAGLDSRSIVRSTALVAV